MADFSTKKILVIDDEPGQVHLVESRLKAIGFDVATASDGVQGMARLKEGEFDLIIVDIQMPNMDGYTFVRELRADDKFGNIPVIVLTGKDQMKELFDVEGISDYIVKPVDGQDFIDKVKKALNG